MFVKPEGEDRLGESDIVDRQSEFASDWGQ